MRDSRLLSITALVVALIFTASCSSIRMRYEARVETKSKKQATYQYEKSTDVGGGLPVICGLTAIFLGGGCWYYLALPSVPQKESFKKDAEAALMEELGKKPYSIQSYEIKQVGWEDAPARSELK